MSGFWDHLSNRTRDRLIVFIAFVATSWVFQQLTTLAIGIYLLLK